MKISRLKTDLVKIPLEKPIRTAIHDIGSVGYVLVTLEGSDGVTGEGFVFTLNAAKLKAFDEVIREFSHLVEGEDPDFVERIWENAWAEMNPYGHKGMTVGALSAIDTACWDMKGKAVGLPLHRMFGACRHRIKTYASGGLWLSDSIDELAREAEQFVADGFHAMKVRIGKPDWRDDFERVRAVRNAIGPNIELMVDANQGLTVKQAIRLGRRLEELDIFWLEEPVAAHDLAGHAEVRSRLDTPVASGESEYSRFGMRTMIEAKAADILMPDLQRIGGLSELRRTAALTSAYNIPISPHLFTEYSLSIAGSAPNCMSVEHMPWNAPLFNEAMEMEDGSIVIPERPGTGFTFNQDAIQQFKIC